MKNLMLLLLLLDKLCKKSIDAEFMHLNVTWLEKVILYELLGWVSFMNEEMNISKWGERKNQFYMSVTCVIGPKKRADCSTFRFTFHDIQNEWKNKGEYMKKFIFFVTSFQHKLGSSSRKTEENTRTSSILLRIRWVL